MLLKKVEHPQLQDAVGALRVRASIDGLTFTECANHLLAQVSELLDNQSALSFCDGGPCKDSSKRKGYVPDGSVWTRYYSDWSQISSEVKQTVLDTRKKNKGKSPKGRKISEVGSKLQDIKAQVAELKHLLLLFIETRLQIRMETNLIPMIKRAIPLVAVKTKSRRRSD
jgi:hypothetical protein